MTSKHHRSKVALIALLIALLPLAGCVSAPAAPAASLAPVASAAPQASNLQGTIAVSGAFALYPMMLRWGEEFQKINPKVEFDISAGGAGKGMADALGGAVDIGMVSRSIATEEEAQGAFWVGVTKDAVFPGVNAQNPVLKELLSKGVSSEVFIDIYITGKITTWGAVVGRPEVTDPIHVYTRSDAAGAPDTWAKYLGNKKQEDLLGIGVFGDPGIADAVVKDPLGIGYNNLNYAFDAKTGKPVAGLAVVPIDVNKNGQADPDEAIDSKAKAIQAISTGKFPSPPARVLNLVTKGKPSGLTKTFLLWVLNDGQKFQDEVGYIPLTQEQLTKERAKLQ
ncbi:MAG: substrate-binding domain-containing protein [Chloroflexi bacterium]|nr:substrate-binding domain-containing protein [Chloroflexota bacterium]